MSASKWSLLDYGKTAHWWVGATGTACGMDFGRDLRRAYEDDPRCRKCAEYAERPGGAA